MTLRRPPIAPAAALAGLALVASPAWADDETLRLTWVAPAGCPSLDEVRSAALRGKGTRPRTGATLEADARVKQEQTTSGSAAWKVQLHTRRGAANGEREIEASTCDGVAEATAVVLALALVSAEPGEPPPPVPAPRQGDAPARAAPTSNGERALALGASVAGDASTLPSAAIGGSLTAAWTPGRFRIELDARRWATQSRTLPGASAGARFSMTAVGGRGCWTALRGSGFDLSPCVGPDAFLVSAPGYGADANYSTDASWIALDAGALGRLSISSRIAMRGRIEASVPLSRPTFVVENAGNVHRLPSVGAAASFGLEVLFL